MITRTASLVRALSADSTAGSFAAKVPTTNEPLGAGVFNAEGVNTLEVTPYGTGADNSTFNIQVIGWRKLQGGANILWVPEEVATLAVTLSTQVGVANTDITASHRFADTLSITSGFASIPTVSANTVVSAFVNMAPYHKFEVLFDAVSATAMNALLSPSEVMLGNPFPVTVISGDPVIGTTAADLPVSGNPLVVAGRGSTATPSAMSADGDVTRLWTDLNGRVVVAGQVAHDAAIAGMPVRTGSRAMTADFTGVATGDQCDNVCTVVGAQVVKPFSIPESSWQYAAAANGIVNTTTAVTIKAAAAAGIRNYITSLDFFHEALTNATELAVRDGSAGTVIWRTKIQSGAAGRVHLNFPSPLRGTAATLLEVVTLTASGAGAVYFNACGYIAP